ncbi:MAG TPA: EAL domain-containing protein [Steroidobacteraceae bacterium]|nr:EAL domain-containing protein [Steroidobacteraceae bacterium]
MLFIVGLGVLLTTVTAALVLLTGSIEGAQLEAALAAARAGAGTAADPALEAIRERVLAAVRASHTQRLWLATGVGLAVTALAAWFAAGRIGRIDRAIRSLLDSAERIGRGRYAEAVPRSGLTEVDALESALERMRSALSETTISRDYLNALLNSLSDAVLVTSPDGRIRTENLAASRLFGRDPGGLLGTELASLIAEPHRPAFSLEKLLQEPGETVVQTQRGQTIPVSVHVSEVSTTDSNFRGHIFVMRDITDRKRAERRIRYLARFDSLTKMPNRMQFQHLLHQAIARATRQGRGLVLLYVDIDNFKEVNDTFGHEAGDRVLETLSERLARILPNDSVTGRLAGDEFAVFAESLDGAPSRHDQAGTLAKLLLQEISRPLHLGEHEIDVTASIGSATCPEDADNVIDLIRNADAAMYHAKRAGRNCHVFYTPEMNAAAVERLMLKSKLRRALDRNEFLVRYQPKVDLASGHVLGAEALLRWRLPEHGEIAPSQFIPLAEESRLILDIGAWVLNQVCSDYAIWRGRVPDPGRIAINLSLKELSHASFIPRCRSVFAKHAVQPSCVELEITETTLMMDAEHTLPLLDELRSMGVHLSIDDFGTGYSSLSALQQFPIGTLKIDRSFVTNAANDPDDATIVRTIIEMGRSLGLQVIAEGIETEEQRMFLLHSGCQFGQGRLFGDPISSADFLDLLLRQATGEHPIIAAPG